MVKKCRGIAEIAVMELAQVGVRTRARTLAMAAANSGTVKRRKLNSSDIKISSSYIQLRSRRRVVIRPENSISTAPETSIHRRTVTDDRCSSPSSDHDHVSASCCSSNGSSEKVNETLKLVDLEDENVEVETSTYYSCRERRETTPSSELQEESDDLDSSARPSEANSRRRSPVEMMPTESELEEFFATSEKNIQKQFSQKYNYDIVKDEPLEGRYEWVRLKP